VAGGGDRPARRGGAKGWETASGSAARGRPPTVHAAGHARHETTPPLPGSPAVAGAAVTLLLRPVAWPLLGFSDSPASAGPALQGGQFRSVPGRFVRGSGRLDDDACRAPGTVVLSGASVLVVLCK
jgi:hypothetical protein